jgi:YggT family protein
MIFLKPLANLINTLLNLYYWAIIIWTTVTWCIQLKIINPFNPLIKNIVYNLSALIQPALTKIKKFIPTTFGNIDISILILLLLLSFLQSTIAMIFG